MKPNVLLYNTETGKTHFTLQKGTRPWGILLAISKGCFRLTFPATGQVDVIHPFEAAYIPPNTEFLREVLAPIDFHQFAFHLYDTSHSIGLPRAGKLPLPGAQLKAVFSSANRLSPSDLHVDAIAEHLLSRILTDAYLFSYASSPSALSPELLTAMDYISQHLAEPLSLPQLAAQVSLSPNGLIRKFKQELNVTPIKYITLCRLKHAKQLLLEETFSITQIAEACGYSNAYYFSNAFKNAEGISPSTFRTHTKRNR